MNPLPRRGGRRTVAAAAGLLAAVVLETCGGASNGTLRSAVPSTANTQAAIAPPDYRVTYPVTWRPRGEVPKSAYLNFLAVGRASNPECPAPLMLVRRQEGPRGSLQQALPAYERIEQLRRPNRRVRAERPVTIAGASEAILIEAEFPRNGPGGATVQSFDLLALSTRGVAFHVFASGCGADLPAGFLTRYILSFDAATSDPGLSPRGLGPKPAPGGAAVATQQTQTVPQSGVTAPTTPASPATVQLSLTAHASVYVCLIGEGRNKLLSGVELAAGQSTPTYNARGFALTLGNSSVTIVINGKPRAVAPSPEAIGYAITEGGAVRRLTGAELPTCM